MILGNGVVITLDKNNPIIQSGAILIKNGKIEDVGESETILKKYPDEIFEDVKGQVIMPGMINPHHHIYSAFARGLAFEGEPPLNFKEILERVWWRLDKKLNLEDTKYSAYGTYIECIRNGVTTVFDHHASPYHLENSLDMLAEAAKDIGIRSCMCYEVSDRDGEEICNKGIEENVRFIKKYNTKDQNMLKGMFGLHASFTLSDETMKKCQKAIKNLDVGYHVHVAEGYEDLVDSKEKYGLRVVERLDKYEVFGPKTLAVHCIHIDDNEINILKNRECNVIHNPESNMGNAVGCAPILKMNEKGITLGLGTDGFTSDIFESLKVGNILQKYENRDPSVGFNEIMKMGLENNRKIAEIYFDGELGVIKKGALADIIVVEYTPFTELNEKNIYGHILFGMSGKSVISTIIDGKFIMKNRDIQTVDEKEILKKSREVSKKMWSRM